MNPNPGREAAYVTSRVKDLSLINNTPDYVGLFSCITPKAGAELEEEGNFTFIDKNGNVITGSEANIEDKVYLPQLVRDVDSLDALFGDPRVDPTTYCDLYAVRNIIQSGFVCYVAKVRSGNPYSAYASTHKMLSGNPPYNKQLDASDLKDGESYDDVSRGELSKLKDSLLNLHLFNVNSSIVGYNNVSIKLVPVKPYSINQVILNIIFTSQATMDSDVSEIANVRIYLSPDTKNADLVKTLNSYLGGELVLSLPEDLDDTGYATIDDAIALLREEDKNYFCISNVLLYICGLYRISVIPKTGSDTEFAIESTDLYAGNMELVGLDKLSDWTKNYPSTTFECTIEEKESASLDVDQRNYVRSFYAYRDPKYAGTFISDLSAPVTKVLGTSNIYALKDPNSFKKAGSETELVDNIEDIYSSFFALLDSNSVYQEGSGYYVLKDSAYGNPENAKILSVTGGDGEPITAATLNINPFYDSEKDDCYNPFDETGKLPVIDKVKFARTGDGYPCTYSKDDNGTYVLKDDHIYDYPKDGPSDPVPVNSEEEDPFEALSASNATYTEPVWKLLSVKDAFDIFVKKDDIVDNYSNDTKTKFTQILEDMTGSGSSHTLALYYVIIGGKYVIVEFPSDLNISDDNNELHAGGNVSKSTIVEMSSNNRRGLHYIIKNVAAQRKDLTCVFTTPYHPTEEEDEELFDLNRACNWVAAKGEFSDLFAYGSSNTMDYFEQSFYCEMYWSWVKWKVAKLVNGLATGSSTVVMPATPFVITNALQSYRSRGSFYPVAGDQRGILPSSCTVLQNPSTKGQRDKLISYRINPIYDTGTRGVQIYGNETLNPQYTDLSAAHIGRTLVQIRSQVDAYSETIKFSLNDQYTWDGWINYVSTRILQPIKSQGGLQWYQVDMGLATTTREEIAQRKIRGMVSLQFTQSLEIIDLEFDVYASSLDMSAEE